MKENKIIRWEDIDIRVIVTARCSNETKRREILDELFIIDDPDSYSVTLSKDPDFVYLRAGNSLGLVKCKTCTNKKTKEEEDG